MATSKGTFIDETNKDLINDFFEQINNNNMYLETIVKVREYDCH